MTNDVRVEEFREEMGFVLRKKFSRLAGCLDGDGRPTTDQLTACFMESAGEVQAKSPYFLPDLQFDKILEHFRNNPYFGESVRPMYDEVHNGNGHEKQRGGGCDV